ncbi:MAG: panthothenate synthetase [bacterium]
MRLILHAKFPNEKFNAMVRDGVAGERLKKIVEEFKPEVVYFTEYGGRRGTMMVVDLKDPSEVPKYAEPLFLMFDAEVEFHVAMTPEEIGKADIDTLAKKWK